MYDGGRKDLSFRYLKILVVELFKAIVKKSVKMQMYGLITFKIYKQFFSYLNITVLNLK